MPIIAVLVSGSTTVANTKLYFDRKYWGNPHTHNPGLKLKQMETNSRM